MGTGHGTQTNNKGIRIDTNSRVSTTSGQVTISGTGAALGTSTNDGVFIANPTTTISTVSSPQFLITGTAGGTVAPNRGVVFENGPLAETTGSAQLTVDGTGGTVGPDSYGLVITGAPTTIRTTGSGTANLIGRASGGTEEGLHLTNSALVTSTANGAIAMTTFSDMLLDGASSITSTSSGTTTLTSSRDLIMASGFMATLTSGAGLFIADRTIDISGSILSSGANLTFVVDNLFPTSPGVGPGAFNFTGSTITTSGELRIYTAMQDQNMADGEIINGTLFTPGPVSMNTSAEEWGIYYPGGTYEGAGFKFYYKQPGAILPPTPGGGVTKQFEVDVAANLVQLPSLLPILKAPRIPYNFPNYHFSVEVLNEKSSPDFSPYGSFIFEDDNFWINGVRKKIERPRERG